MPRPENREGLLPAAEPLRALGAWTQGLPGMGTLRGAYANLEQTALHELKARLDGLEPVSGASAVLHGSEAVARNLVDVDPRALLRGLLAASTELDKDAARRCLYSAILQELTPDEACLLATLSDGTRFASINITAGGSLGAHRTVASNFSSIERQSPIKLRECAPGYIEHLLSLGLAEVGPENKEDETQYQILEGNARVQALVAELKKTNRNVRFERGSLVISELGRELWAYCDPGREPDEI